MNYWNECISEALEDAKIVATSEQIDIIASWAESAHENYGQAHGYENIPNPLENENELLKRALIKEQEKMICGECNGRGRIIRPGPVHSSESECWKCRGEGRK